MLPMRVYRLLNLSADLIETIIVDKQFQLPQKNIRGNPRLMMAILENL
jgi:hypothetical protein